MDALTLPAEYLIFLVLYSLADCDAHIIDYGRNANSRSGASQNSPELLTSGLLVNSDIKTLGERPKPTSGTLKPAPTAVSYCAKARSGGRLPASLRFYF